MKETRESTGLERRPYSAPVLTRYRPSDGAVREYQASTSATASIKCTNPDDCSGAEGAAALPPWLLP